MVGKGRPLKTDIREKIGTILKHKKACYGYRIYKIYNDVFDSVSLRNLYYNLKKGLELGEFVIVEVKKERGNFTWGDKVERKYYSIGPQALFYKPSEREKEKLKELKEKEFKINWEEEIKNQIKKLKNKIKEFNSKKSKMRYEDQRKREKQLKSNINSLKGWSKEKSNKKEVQEKIEKLNDVLE